MSYWEDYRFYNYYGKFSLSLNKENENDPIYRAIFIIYLVPPQFSGFNHTDEMEASINKILDKYNQQFLKSEHKSKLSLQTCKTNNWPSGKPGGYMITCYMTATENNQQNMIEYFREIAIETAFKIGLSNEKVQCNVYWTKVREGEVY